MKGGTIVSHLDAFPEKSAEFTPVPLPSPHGASIGTAMPLQAEAPLAQRLRDKKVQIQVELCANGTVNYTIHCFVTRFDIRLIHGVAFMSTKRISHPRFAAFGV